MVWEFVDEPQQEQSFGERLKGAGKETLRQAGRAGAAVTAGAVGGIGDIANLLSMGAEKVGLASPEGAREFREKTLTSEKIRRGLQEQFPSLQPENKIEKFSDEVFETLGGLGAGGPGKTIVNKSLRKLGLSIGANLGKEFVDQVKSEEGSKEGNYAKAGLLFIGSLINPKLAAKEASKKYETARSFLPEGSVTSAENLSKNLNSLTKDITKGRPYSSLGEAEKFVINKIDKVNDLIVDGKIPVDQLWAQKKSLHNDLSALYKDFGREEAKTIKNLSKKIPTYLNKSLKEYGRSNPSFYKNMKEADEIYGTLAKSESLNEFINNYFPHSPWSRAGLLVGEKTIGSVPKMVYKAYSSPEIRNLYAKAISKASKEDLKGFAKVMDDLEEKLTKSDNEERWEFID